MSVKYFIVASVRYNLKKYQIVLGIVKKQIDWKLPIRLYVVVRNIETLSNFANNFLINAYFLLFNRNHRIWKENLNSHGVVVVCRRGGSLRRTSNVSYYFSWKRRHHFHLFFWRRSAPNSSCYCTQLTTKMHKPWWSADKLTVFAPSCSPFWSVTYCFVYIFIERATVNPTLHYICAFIIGSLKLVFACLLFSKMILYIIAHSAKLNSWYAEKSSYYTCVTHTKCF